MRRVVSQGWLHASWRPRFTASHLSWTTYPRLQHQAVVKVHGVFPSSHGYSASSPRLQFHRVPRGDSGQVVTPFVQVGTYPTRNFAQRCYVPEEERVSRFGSAHLCASPRSSDHIILQRLSWRSGVWPLRISRVAIRRAIFPADCLHRTDCHSSSSTVGSTRRPSI